MGAVLRRYWPTISLVLGVVMFCFGVSGYRGGVPPSQGCYDAVGEEVVCPGSAAGFPREARVEMAVGAGLVAVGIIGFRGTK